MWHHTSILRTNLIWMSGVIDLEGRSKGVVHPALGEIITDASKRRAMLDFPPLAWFTTEITVPNCLRDFNVYGKDRVTGQVKPVEIEASAVDALVLNRMALGFTMDSIPVVPWPDHRGYTTAEGRDLNDAAREVGDDPDKWFVAEEPVDVMKVTQVRGSKSISSLKMERMDEYVAEIRRMVTLCRQNPGAYIPPTWVGSSAHRALERAGSKIHYPPEMIALGLAGRG